LLDGQQLGLRTGLGDPGILESHDLPRVVFFFDVAVVDIALIIPEKRRMKGARLRERLV